MCTNLRFWKSVIPFSLWVVTRFVQPCGGRHTILPGYDVLLHNQNLFEGNTVPSSSTAGGSLNLIKEGKTLPWNAGIQLPIDAVS